MFSGSSDGRDAIMNALLPGHTSEIINYENDKQSQNDVEFILKMKNVVPVGSNFDVELQVENKSDDQRNVLLFENKQISFFTLNFMFVFCAGEALAEN